MSANTAKTVETAVDVALIVAPVALGFGLNAIGRWFRGLSGLRRWASTMRCVCGHDFGRHAGNGFGPCFCYPVDRDVAWLANISRCSCPIFEPDRLVDVIKYVYLRARKGGA